MTDRIVVAGDAHLGSATADEAAFGAFLDGVYEDRARVDHLVLLGDVWDLVRRDPFGCVWETSETVTRIKRVASALPVHLVFGNHDAHLRGLDDALYDVAFRETLALESGDAAVRFCHGNEFDRLQSDRLSAFLSGRGDRGDIDPTRGRKDPVVAKGRELVAAGKRRLRTGLGRDRGDATESAGAPFPRRERRAHAYLETVPEDKLVFGHTHAPYVRADGAVANPGSWKSTAPVHNTYLVVADGSMTLYRHRTGGADEPVDAPTPTGR